MEDVPQPHKRVRDAAIRSVIESAAVAAGIPRLTPHDLRRTFATRSLDAGSDLSLVQKLMGHRNVRTTTQYDRRDVGPKREAVEKLAGAYNIAMGPSGPQLSIDEIFGARIVATMEELHRFGGCRLLSDAVEGGFIRYAPVRLNEEPFAPDFLRQFSGGPDHKILCALGARWIEARGLLWGSRRNQCKYEAGGVADVMSTDRTIAIECGRTEPTKIVLALHHGMKTVLYIPFRWDLRTPSPYGFIFQRTDQESDARLTEIVARCKRNEDAFQGTRNITVAQRNGPIPASRVKAYAKQILGPHFRDPDEEGDGS
jgi:hypothetical protein